MHSNLFSQRTKFIIPARKGSKGLPGKNRLLFHRTIGILRPEMLKQTLVTSDDGYILDLCSYHNIPYIVRPNILANDKASIKDVLIHVREEKKWYDDVFVLLYLTYPNRKLEDIDDFVELTYHITARSILCKQEVLTHPYMCITEDGKKLIPHNLYRRQDYPKVFEASHYLAAARASNLEVLDPNLFHETTHFMPISRQIDVDLPSDLFKVGVN